MLGVQREAPARTLILAQKSVLHSAWQDDAEEMGERCIVAHHPRKSKRLELINTPGNVIIATNYETFRNHADAFMSGGFHRLIVDESSKCKNPESKTTKAITKFADTLDQVFLLTGSPAPNDPSEYWAQLRMISEKAAGKDFYRWAHHWMIPEMKTIQRGGRVKKVISGWKLKSGMSQKFAQYLSRWAWSLSESECKELPKMVNKRYDLDPSTKERRALKSMEEDFCLEVNDSAIDLDGAEIEGSLTLPISVDAKFIKLRQAAGGYVKTDNGIQCIGSTKMKMLEDIIESNGRGEPVLIWAEFTAEIDAIHAKLNALGRTVGVLDGRTKDGRSVVRNFVESRSNAIIAHPKSAGHGTDGLQRVCRHAIYYSYSFSADEHWQSKKRLHRDRQKFPPVYHYLVMKDTLDERALEVLAGKISRQAAILSEVRRIAKRQ